MSFRTEYHFVKADIAIQHCDSIVMMGSCFSENIGRILQRYRFDVNLNSHGILFNPMAIANALDDVINEKKYVLNDLLNRNGIFISLNHHGAFSSDSATESLNRMNDAISSAHQKLKNASVLMLTFGSAWGYVFKSTNRVVANCHKIPQSEFDKKLITHAEIEFRFEELFSRLKKFNPKLKVVFTVSPVRHLRDGFFENQISKGHLIIAISNLMKKGSQFSYFPAYEIVLDDLRDYRFFNEDMIHPNSTAIQYVWEKFVDWCIDSSTNELLQKLDPLLKFLEHRPMKIEESLHEKIRNEKSDEIQRLIDAFHLKPEK